jgi:hypothetical protein
VLQLVASRRGVAALPNWGVKNYVDHDYVLAKRIGTKGLWSELYATVPAAIADRPYVDDFVSIVRDICAAELDGIELLGTPAAQAQAQAQAWAASASTSTPPTRSMSTSSENSASTTSTSTP